MDARRTFPTPPDLGIQIRSLATDLQRARVNLATGKLHPEQYAFLARVLEGRLETVEAEVQRRLRSRLN